LAIDRKRRGIVGLLLVLAFVTLEFTVGFRWYFFALFPFLTVFDRIVVAEEAT